jgi:tRNA threonylcarbamoyladenosine biosynthesis protein TsaB
MKLLAFDCSTDRLSIAVQRARRIGRYRGAGGRESSSTLIPTILRLLAEAGIALRELDAIVFGRGPGSFTGLRTACSVAQGLGFGAGVPVLPVDTLLAVAEEARAQHGAHRVLALLDARMNQVYAAAWGWDAAAGWSPQGETVVCAPEAVRLPSDAGDTGWALAGNAFESYGARLPRAVAALPRFEAWPGADALLRLAPAGIQAGRAVSAEQALPLYVRDKVARTIAERAASSRR